MMDPLNIILWAFLCGALSVSYHVVLIAPGHILSPWRRFLEDHGQWIREWTNYGLAWRIYSWLTQSLTDCCWCLAGQIALFHFILTANRQVTTSVWIFSLAFQIGAAIITSLILFEMFKKKSHGQANR